MNEEQALGKFGYRIRACGDSIATTNLEITEIAENVIALSENIFMFRNKTIGHHSNIFEGEIKSLVYGVRPCVIKFATLSEQNVREAEILTKLGSHTNVIAIIQSGTYQDVFEEHVYIALDKCHNENLRQYLASRRTTGADFNPNQAVDFAKQIIAGVMYLHDNNVIHLDLKPSNILITQDMRIIKIADFGLSIMVKSPKSKVFHKRQFGTNGYRPIESFGNGEVSMRTDIFSLGTVLLHLLSNGNDVFGCDEHIFVHNLMNDVTDTSGLLVANPIATEHLIKCMVSKERCRRPNIWEVSDHPCWSGEEIECLHACLQLVCQNSRNFARISNFWGCAAPPPRPAVSLKYRDFLALNLHPLEYSGDNEIEDHVTCDKTDLNVDKVSSQPDNGSGRKFIERAKEMGFNRKPTIVVFDRVCHQLYIFDHRRKSTTKLNNYPMDRTRRNFTAVAFGEYIYIFLWDCSVYRLEYGDTTATWKRLNNSATGLVSFPLSVASANTIYHVSLTRNWATLPKCRNIVFKYMPAIDRWERLKDKTTVTRKSALLCNDEYLYCFGGVARTGKQTDIVERLDLMTMEWERITNMTRPKYDLTAAEYKNILYVIGRDIDTAMPVVDTFNSEADQWMEIKSNDLAYLKWLPQIVRNFQIDGCLFLVCKDALVKYDIVSKTWSVVKIFRDDITAIVEAVLVKMS